MALALLPYSLHYSVGVRISNEFAHACQASQDAVQAPDHADHKSKGERGKTRTVGHKPTNFCVRAVAAVPTVTYDASCLIPRWMKTSMRHKLFIIAGALVVAGAAVGGGLYYVYPVQVSTIAGMTRNYFISWSAPPGTITTELNPAYKPTAATGPSAPAAAPSPNAAKTGRATTKHSLRSVTRCSARSTRRMSVS